MEAGLVGILAGHQDRHLLALPEQTFRIEGPNGTHDAVVLPVAGPTSSQYMDELEGNRLPLDVRKKVIREIIRGLACLHESGVGHGGSSLTISNGFYSTNMLRSSRLKYTPPYSGQLSHKF